MRLALIVEYEGTRFHGFQYQTNASSIQEELERAIERFTGEKTRVRGAGRTDAGVHAKGQVVAFDTDTARETVAWTRGLNSYLPHDIAVGAAFRVPEDFDPRRQAISRRYKYRILNRSAPSPLLRRTTHQVTEPLDVEAMHQAARLLLGQHDFARFCGPVEAGAGGTVREIYEASVDRVSDIVTLNLVGNAFLPHQVRRMAGALVDLGRRRLSKGEFQRMIDAEENVRIAHSLPAQGLCLMEVRYTDFPPKAGETDDDE